MKCEACGKYHAIAFGKCIYCLDQCTKCKRKKTIVGTAFNQFLCRDCFDKVPPGPVRRGEKRHYVRKPILEDGWD